jgi:hypothetical protein
MKRITLRDIGFIAGLIGILAWAVYVALKF